MFEIMSKFQLLFEKLEIKIETYKNLHVTIVYVSSEISRATSFWTLDVTRLPLVMKSKMAVR